MNRILSCIGLCIFILTADSLAKDRPNFVFLFSDDQQADSIGAWGNPNIQTPNMDRLAKQGHSFRNAYCAGSFSGAVCVASRSMLMTGRNWLQITDKKNWKGLNTLPRVLSENGYEAHIVGKWHNGRNTLLRSFESGTSVFLGGMTNHLQVPLADIQEGAIQNQRSVEGFSSTMFADAAVEFLNQKREKPFFLYVAFTAPHDTRNPPPKYREIYYKKDLPLPKNFMPLHPFDNGSLSPKFRDENLAPWPRPKGMIRDQISEYYGLITHLDEQIGKVLEALENNPQAKNTYVIFTSDHGLALGRHGLMGKQSLYEHSMRSPLIIRGPGVPAESSSQALVYLHDLYPTILKLAGQSDDTAEDAANLEPLWLGEKTAVRDHLFMAFQSQIRSIRDERWKLLIYPQINHRQLYDLQSDPDELFNLAMLPEHEETLKRLTTSMGEWQKTLGDDQALSSTNPKSKDYDYTKFKQKRDRWQPDWIFKKYFKNH
ncbi:MAG: sulfatase-like hydrolase/transferase [Akkermansiaceae bacterium]